VATTYKRIETVRKAIEILKYLSKEKEPAQAKNIAQAVGLPVGTLMCHLATLEDAGYVRTLGDRFDLGFEIALAWARKKATLEGEKTKIEGQLESLGT
jgi:DNA-binding IclR family transcriptional regulator